MMKTKISILLLVFIFTSSCLFAKSDGYDLFYKTHKKHHSVINLDIPVIILGFFLDSDDDKEIRKLLRKTDDFKVFYAEGSKTHFLPIMKDYLPNDIYKDFLIVKESGENVSIKIKEAEDVISEIVLLVEEGQDLIAISIKGEFTADDLMEYMNAIDNGSITDAGH